ncbi:MAG TPA: alpha/beta fold hydrolase [Mesotoga infera]|uniref:Alpha/beta fold hydrolase n=1 Tax=Mesotoga infera TaxID=1236046 RepID=A0A7C1GZB3_9BACT|nr:alpha/beta fold hydrolase [Mesotoga infera]
MGKNSDNNSIGVFRLGIALAVVLLFTSTVCLPYEGQILFNGNRIYYELEEAEGEFIVIVGDGPGLDSSYMKGAFNHGKFLRYDQLGSGMSQNLSSLDITFQYYISELAALIYTLNVDSFHLIGHGFGGAVAVGLALTNPPGLLSLVIVNPRLNYPAIDSALVEAVAQESVKDLDKFELLFGSSSEPERESSIAKNSINMDTYNLFWGDDSTFINGVLRGFDLSCGLPDINVPVLVCAGLESFPGVVHTATYQVGALESEFVTFMNSGNFPMIEEPTAFKSIVEDFHRRVEEAAESDLRNEAHCEVLSETPGERIFRLQDSERTLVMQVGDDFTVMLPSNPGAGYFWRVESFDEDVLRLISDPFYEEPKEAGSGYDVFGFRVVGSGSSPLVFSFGSSWDIVPMKSCSMLVQVEEYFVDPLIIHASDSGKTFIVGLNEPIEVVLESTVSSNLSWRIALTTPGIVRQPKESESRVFEDSSGLARKIEKVYYFEGMNYGEATLEFAYGSPWDDVPPEKTFEATLIVTEPFREVAIIQDSDNGREIEIGNNQTIIIKLKKALATDGEWKISPSNTKFHLIQEPYEEEYSKVSYSVFRLRPTELGESQLEFYYIENESNEQPVGTFTITIQTNETMNHSRVPLQ